MEQEIHGLQVEAGGRSWLAEVEVWGGIQGHHLLQTDLVSSKNTTGLRPEGTQAFSSYQRKHKHTQLFLCASHYEVHHKLQKLTPGSYVYSKSTVVSQEPS